VPANTPNTRFGFSTDGTFLTKWGSRGAGKRIFDGPQCVTVDANGNVYVTDWAKRFRSHSRAPQRCTEGQR
jgi:hypothetical protein